MELKIGKRVADYRLVYFQPEPETGERLCIALLFSEPGGRRTLLYDDKFSRVRCFAPYFEVGLLRFLMRSLEEQLSDRDLDMDQALLGLGSQLSLSPERRIATPLTNAAKIYLLERFVVRKELSVVSELAAASSQKVEPEALFAEHVLKFAGPLLATGGRRFIKNATPMEVLGRKLPGTESVSLSIATQDKVTVIDGVDLAIQAPKEVIRRTGKVAHTFWQYRHYSGNSVLPRRVERVALIFNGKEDPRPKYRDAQEFAREILTKESELVLEHETEDDLKRLETLLAS